MPKSLGDFITNLDGVFSPAALSVSGTTSTSGDVELIAAPGASKRIVVEEYMVQNAGATAKALLLKAGSTETRRVWCQNQGDGMARCYPAGRPWRLPANTALVLVDAEEQTARRSKLLFGERALWL